MNDNIGSGGPISKGDIMSDPTWESESAAANAVNRASMPDCSRCRELTAKIAELTAERDAARLEAASILANGLWVSGVNTDQIEEMLATRGFRSVMDEDGRWRRVEAV